MCARKNHIRTRQQFSDTNKMWKTVVVCCCFYCRSHRHLPPITWESSNRKENDKWSPWSAGHFPHAFSWFSLSRERNAFFSAGIIPVLSTHFFPGLVFRGVKFTQLKPAFLFSLRIKRHLFVTWFVAFAAVASSFVLTRFSISGTSTMLAIYQLEHRSVGIYQLIFRRALRCFVMAAAAGIKTATILFVYFVSFPVL